MPRVACFGVAGLELWFNSHDHLPPHFHAERPGEWQVRVFFLREGDEMFEVVYSTRANRPSRADVKVLARESTGHRVALLAAWERVVLVTEGDR